MKRFNILQTKIHNKITVTMVAVVVFFMAHPVYAQAVLTNAEKALTKLKTDLATHIIPVAATVILLCLAIGYAGRYIEKDTFVRWAIGVVIAGSATQIATMLFGGVA
ncbi:VirB2 family type IV secretion system major pilin TrwL [Candidatus Bartonella washoeensis]|uniref:Uncharacterized protein n=1 Tax=Cardidatus Bartonella washoeensis 085-0475 TaxID=1094564 RepID=J1JIL9_9HYPH|nr:VirB2 family type IV secretion system major pilin TrwL [Bartonella washoeensis]EJF84442.1 hypothetical protein MCW_01152 [Bartonella washoeensis 085-0475]